MEKFKLIYNQECTTAINEGWEGFLIPEGEFVAFYDRNEKMLQETMKEEIDAYLEDMVEEEIDYSCKSFIAREYLFQKLGIGGFGNEMYIQFDELELIDQN